MSSSTALVPTNGPAATQLALELGAELAATSLSIGNLDLLYEDWENIGRAIGFVGNASRWWFGDWINFGGDLYGETAFAATEATPADRYDIAGRVTGLSPETLKEYAFVAANVAVSRRRLELPFSVHKPVAKLDPDDQERWLALAVEEGWTSSELKAAIKEELHPALPIEDEAEEPALPPGISIAERIETAARLVYRTWQPQSDGSYNVPPESAAQLIAALGEER